VSAPLLRVSDLSRRFEATVALDRVSFAVARGEVLALLGENGAGKSTLVEVLSGGLRSDGGELQIDGRAYAPRDARQARGKGVAVVHQHFQHVEAFTVAENLRLAAPEMVPVAREAELAALWARLGDELGVSLPSPQARVGDLGVGERQWLEIAKAAWGSPRLLLLDEPTAVLTPGEAEQLFSAVRRRSSTGAAVLFITHRLDEVRRVADRVVVLRRGRVVAGLPAAASTDELAAAMTGELPPPAPRRAVAAGRVVASLRGVAVPVRLQPLDLDVHEREIVALAGVDGNGQVAAAERLAGIVQGPGVVEIEGRAVPRPNPGCMRSRGVNVIPADRTRQGTVAELSVAENLILGDPTGAGLLHPARLEERASKLIERFQIVGRPGQPAAELSGGNQQKLVVARALTGRPKIIVAMHPTRGLDVAAQIQVHRFLLEASAGGAGVLLVTADLEEARSVADRILVFSRGRVVGEGDSATPLELLGRWIGGEAA